MSRSSSAFNGAPSTVALAGPNALIFSKLAAAVTIVLFSILIKIRMPVTTASSFSVSNSFFSDGLPRLLYAMANAWIGDP
jgi:hypothetical protein